ncbi:MAG: family 16 glycosylhydrolase [Oscillospiraceae bacterium]|nr:family 16 glycosylhydrolase [Oscillospiraceae bacterium]
MKKIFLPITAIITALGLLGGCAANSESRTSGTGSDPQGGSSAGARSNAEPTAVPELAGYNLLWNDEFDGDKLDESIWNRELREPGWTNNELQEYTDSDENIFVKDGKLILKAAKTERNGKDYYTSGKVNSQHNKPFTYGKVVVSAKTPVGQGLWPAIWMMPEDESYYGQWPRCGEIDIMETLGHDLSTAYCTVHYGAPHAEQQGTITGNFGKGFHEYSVEWEPGEMRWYVDGSEVLVVNDWFSGDEGQDDKPYPAPFDQPFFVQMNLAVGGNWPGNPDATTDFDKAQFEIDYVRVYQKPSYDTNVTKPEVNYREPLADGNLIYNGDFAEAEDLSDDKIWTFYHADGGNGTAEIKDNTLIITTEKEGTKDYSVQIFQPELPMMKGKNYRVSFDAYSDEARKMIVAVTAPTAGWRRYLNDTKFDITTEKKTYTFDFTMSAKNDPNGRLEFNMGHCGSIATIYISNVRVEEVE